ncbi:MAG: DNA alkylation repair protein [Rubrivivax sp.]
MEPFKNLLNRGGIEATATRLHAAWPAFDTQRFVQLAADGLDGLEMKARALQICSALESTLPTHFEQAATVLEHTLRGDDALEGWMLWPVGEFVARRGLATPARGLQVLHALTQRFTAEFAIRPFLVEHPQLTLATLARWAHDGSEHVRRLVSEGSRPRLPWGLRLKALVDDPQPTLPLLLALQDDPSAYVRRSVANHLNDIAKDHPGLVAEWLETHLPGAAPERRRLLRHASRTLIKQGDRRVLAAWGLGKPLRGTAVLVIAPKRIVLGDTLTLELQLISSSPRPQKLAVDYAVHHVKADGGSSAKVFKGWTTELPPHGTLQLSKRHAVKPITTRRYHAGHHAVDVQVNGQVVASAGFTLKLA